MRTLRDAITARVAATVPVRLAATSGKAVSSRQRQKASRRARDWYIAEAKRIEKLAREGHQLDAAVAATLVLYRPQGLSQSAFLPRAKWSRLRAFALDFLGRAMTHEPELAESFFDRLTQTFNLAQHSLSLQLPTTTSDAALERFYSDIELVVGDRPLGGGEHKALHSALDNYLNASSYR